MVSLRCFRLCAALGGGLALALRAEPIGEAEALRPPTAQRIDATEAEARRNGWAGQIADLRRAAQAAYAKDKLPAAGAWLGLCRWAALFAEDEAVFTPRWIRCVQDEKVAHGNMATRYELRSRPLGAALAPELQAWLLRHGEFTETFFALIQPVDYLPGVLRILNELYGRDPAQFASCAQLALALAVVYDVPAPPDWPHGQIARAGRKREWPAAGDAFAWWVEQDRQGRTFHRLAQLDAAELKFVVDATADFDDLAWTQQVANYPLNQWEKAYRMVSYRPDRLANGKMFWPGADYSLPRILADGGICVDQAYFAAQAGKARGVPTLLFYGAGNDGRHAWFGFLNAEQQWRLDAGRYAEQRLVTGYARDPQTWRLISDHELKFISERFRTLPGFRQARVSAALAADFLATGDPAAAARAARNAVRAEPRYREAWDTLLAAEGALDLPPREREAMWQAAARAFGRYPELEAFYTRQAVASLRARGQGSMADEEERRLTRKYLGGRSDLSLQQARETLLRAIGTQPPEVQLQTYASLLAKFGAEAGIGFFDQIVVAFVEHLVRADRPADAVLAIERTRAGLKVTRGSQFDQELTRLMTEVKKRSPRR